jgi:hypothetical protein
MQQPKAVKPAVIAASPATFKSNTDLGFIYCIETRRNAVGNQPAPRLLGVYFRIRQARIFTVIMSGGFRR